MLLKVANLIYELYLKFCRASMVGAYQKNQIELPCCMLFLFTFMYSSSILGLVLETNVL